MTESIYLKAEQYLYAYACGSNDARSIKKWLHEMGITVDLRKSKNSNEFECEFEGNQFIVAI